MDEMQLNEILSSYRDAINALIERADAQDEMVKAVKNQCDELNHIIFDEVINPATEAMNQAKYDQDLSEFGARYADKFDGYNDKLRPIEGDEFDIVKQAYDGYNEMENKPDEGMYVEELIKQVDSQLDTIREKLGVAPDAKVEVVDEGDGEPEVKVDGQPVEGEAAQAEEAPEEAPAEDVEVTENEETSNPEELEALEKELLDYKK